VPRDRASEQLADVAGPKADRLMCTDDVAPAMSSSIGGVEALALDKDLDRRGGGLLEGKCEIGASNGRENEALGRVPQGPLGSRPRVSVTPELRLDRSEAFFEALEQLFELSIRRFALL
jgi:hypothetical protein